MAVFMETSAGDIVVDLYVKEAPLASKNFLKLCKIKYYNGHLFYNVQQNFMVQAGDPTGTGRGGTSVYGLMYGEQAKYFEDEIHPTLKHDRSGLLCMANHGPNTNGSQFFFTTRGDDLDHLDGKNTIFGNVAEGMEVLMKINEQFVDDNGRPFRDMRILHTAILDDPFDDPPQLEVPENSPERDRPEEEDLVPRLGLDEDPDAGREGLDEEELELMEKRREAQSRAVVLEMIGDLPDAEMAPPDNALFVCKLNPATRDDDLELIFSRFGPVADCSIIRDHLTGDSLNYAFVEFEKEEDCEQAYYKMNNVLIDDRRIKVDFSQSVSKLWNNFNNRKRAGPKGGQSSKGDHDKKYNANYVPVGNQNEGMGTRQRERSPAAVPPNIKREGRGECRNQETQRRDNSRDRRQQQAKRDDRGEYHNNNNQEKRRRDNSGDRRRQAREEQQSMKADDGGKERPTRDRKYDDRTSLSSGGKKRRSRSRSRDRRHSSRSDTKREREEKKSSRKKDEQGLGSRRRRDEDHHHKRYKAEERRQEEHHGKHDRRRR